LFKQKGLMSADGGALDFDAIKKYFVEPQKNANWSSAVESAIDSLKEQIAGLPKFIV